MFFYADLLKTERVQLTSRIIVNQPFGDEPDTYPTPKIAVCRTGILPVDEKAAKS